MKDWTTTRGWLYPIEWGPLSGVELRFGHRLPSGDYVNPPTSFRVEGRTSGTYVLAGVYDEDGNDETVTNKIETVPLRAYQWYPDPSEARHG